MKPRVPPACVICSDKKERKIYESQGIAGRLIPMSMTLKKLTKLVLCKQISDYEFHCTKCGWSRPHPVLEVDGVTYMYFQSCKKCGERHITPELGKCAGCDLDLFVKFSEK